MKRILLLMILIMYFSGCAASREQAAVVFENAETFPTESITEFPLLDSAEGMAAERSYEELYLEFGKIYCTQNENRDYLLSVSDYEAGERYPLCPKPNCRHDSSECGAFFSFVGGKPDYLHYDGSYLYYFSHSEMTLYRQNMDGSGREMTVELSKAVFAVNTILYEKKTAWLLCELMEMEEESSELNIRKAIVQLDLTTGKWQELPYSFDCDRTNVELYGKYGDALLLRYTYSVGAVPWKNMEESRSIMYLMDLNTGTITKLTEYEFTYVSSAKCPGYLIYCIFDPITEYEVRYLDKAWQAFKGEILIFDLTERVCYTMSSDCLTWEFSIRDGKLFYCELGDDGKTLEGKIRELDTGETIDWVFFDAQPQIRWLAENETGNEFIVICEDQICRITKEDYFAGNRNLIPIP